MNVPITEDLQLHFDLLFIGIFSQYPHAWFFCWRLYLVKPNSDKKNPAHARLTNFLTWFGLSTTSVFRLYLWNRWITTYLRGKFLVLTAFWMVLMKHFWQRTWCWHGYVMMVAWQLTQIRHSSSSLLAGTDGLRSIAYSRRDWKITKKIIQN